MPQTIDYGIDLGTTNSAIALCRAGEVRIFQSADLMNVTPSVVYVSRSGRMLVGKKAYDTWAADQSNTQAEFKRWMGFSDRLDFPASNKQLSAEELSAEVLKSLRADAERQTGETITAAVVTVPAAFGSLQCEATGRAARLAGLTQTPLLQEPIAAAVAYGASPESRDQRWMVFDLGGGTLDIAIVSTRNGRLAVLEHQGNNRLGGKDIDRAIAESLLLPPLAATFAVPDAKADPQAYGRLMRSLTRHAEQAKITLSMAADTVVDLFDLGDDADGNAMELSITVRRDEMEAKVGPVVEQCLDLARRALEGARLSGADLDRVLLVGGPTQMPVLRDALQSSLGARLDYSLDPMTVVARGAALYASTLEKTTPASAVAPPPPPRAAGVVPVQLSYERASGTPQSPVVGVIDAKWGVREVKIDAAGGWTSGWLAVADGVFQADVALDSAKTVTRFTLSAHGAKGEGVKVDPADFSITYMLPMGAAPLPHAMAIELSTINGVTKFDSIFRRHCPLPAEARKTYKSDRTLRPSEVGTTLPIKFWEIEVSDDPQEKWWAGCVHVRADRIKRPIPEGTDIELTVKIDASRKMTVELTVPLLDESFSNEVYIPDPPTARSQLRQQLDLCFERLNHVGREIYAEDRGDLAPRYEALQIHAETIAERVGEDTDRNAADPDASLAPTEALRKLSIALTHLEKELQMGGKSSLAKELRWQVRYVGRVVEAHGTEAERREVEKLRRQYEQYAEADDARGLKWVENQLKELHWACVKDQRWFWQDRLAYLKQPGRRFLNREQAGKALQEAAAADARDDLAGLRAACNRAWGLLPPDQLEAAREQEAQSGLRGA